MRKNGFFIYGSDHCPICPVLFRDPYYVTYFETGLWKLGFYTIGLAYPVIPIGTARSRIIVTTTHTNEQIDGLVAAFKKLADLTPFFEDLKNDTKIFEERDGKISAYNSLDLESALPYARL